MCWRVHENMLTQRLPHPTRLPSPLGMKLGTVTRSPAMYRVSKIKRNTQFLLLWFVSSFCSIYRDRKLYINSSSLSLSKLAVIVNVAVKIVAWIKCWISDTFEYYSFSRGFWSSGSPSIIDCFTFSASSVSESPTDSIGLLITTLQRR